MPPRRQRTARVLLPFPPDRLSELSWSELWQLHDEARQSGGVVQGHSNLLQLKAHLAREALRDCRLCERNCGIDRLKGETAYCGVAEQSYVGSEFIHMGEEPELVPSYAVFLAGCTFHCVYCQAHKVAFNPQA